MDSGIINQPLSFLLFSDFAVVVAYVHLNTLFMIVPIFNSMAQHRPGILEAAHDAGASRWRVVAEVVLPLSKTGIALGVDLRHYAGDGRLLRRQRHERRPERLGGLRAVDRDREPAISAGGGERRRSWSSIVRPDGGRRSCGLVDVRKELTGEVAPCPARSRSSALDVLCTGGVLRAVRAIPLRADDRHLVLSFQGPDGGLTFPLIGSLAALVRRARSRRSGPATSTARSTARSGSPLIVTVLTVLLSVMAGLAFRRRFHGAGAAVLHRGRQPDHAGPVRRIGIARDLPLLGLDADLVRLGARRAADLDAAVWPADHVRGAGPLRSLLRGGRERSGRKPIGSRLRNVVLPIVLPGIIGVALFGFTLSYDEFPRTLLTVGTKQYAAARNLGDDDQRHLAGPLRPRHGHDGRLLHRHRRGAGLDRLDRAPTRAA